MLKVGAIVAVNARGDIYDWKDGKKVAGLLNADRKTFADTEEAVYKSYEVVKNKFTGATENTTIGAVITNAAFPKSSLCKIAGMAHDGYARAIRPVHTSSDGDSIYALSVGGGGDPEGCEERGVGLRTCWSEGFIKKRAKKSGCPAKLCRYDSRFFYTVTSVLSRAGTDQVPSQAPLKFRAHLTGNGSYMVRGRGNRAFGIGHSDLEVGTRLLKKIVGKIFTAKGIRAFVDGISEVFVTLRTVSISSGTLMAAG